MGKAKSKKHPGTPEGRYDDFWRAFMAISDAGEADDALVRFRTDQRQLAARIYSEGVPWRDFPARTGLSRATVSKVVPVGSRPIGKPRGPHRKSSE